MERINTTNKDADLFGGGKHGFRDGNPGLGIFATFLSAAWFNTIQEEIANVVEFAGLVLNAGDRTQLRQAIESLNSHGQCRLTKSGANLVLAPRDGNRIKINGVSKTVPAAGVTLAPAGLMPVTTFRARNANVATLTVAANHNLAVNEYVKILGVGGTGYTGLVQVTGIPTATSFTYASVGGNEGTTADAAGTVERDLLIFAYMAGAVMTMEAVGRGVGHSADATTGVEIKTGDATRALVGMARITAGAVWVSSAAQQFVISWFSRRALPINAGPVSASTASTSTVELNTAVRAEILSWADEASQTGILSSVSNGTTGAVSRTAVGVNSATAVNTALEVQAYTTNALGNTSHSFAASLAEGYSYITAVGNCTAGTSNWAGLSIHGQLIG